VPVRRLAVSFVWPEQPPTVPAGQLSFSVMNLPERVSLVETSVTPANRVVELEPELEEGGGAGRVAKLWSCPCQTPALSEVTSRKW